MQEDIEIQAQRSRSNTKTTTDLESKDLLRRYKLLGNTLEQARRPTPSTLNVSVSVSVSVSCDSVD